MQRSGKMLGGMDYGGYSEYSRQAMMDLGCMQTLVHQTQDIIGGGVGEG